MFADTIKQDEAISKYEFGSRPLRHAQNQKGGSIPSERDFPSERFLDWAKRLP